MTRTSSTVAVDLKDLSDVASNSCVHPEWEVLQGESVLQIVFKLFIQAFGFSFIGPIFEELLLKYFHNWEFRAVLPFRLFLLT